MNLAKWVRIPPIESNQTVKKSLSNGTMRGRKARKMNVEPFR